MRRFMILAPESSWAEEWQMASASQPFTMDWNHVEACYQWVTHIPGVRVDNRCRPARRLRCPLCPCPCCIRIH